MNKLKLDLLKASVSPKTGIPEAGTFDRAGQTRRPASQYCKTFYDKFL